MQEFHSHPLVGGGGTFILGKRQACLLRRLKIRKKSRILGELVLLDGNIM
jgi:hypothetical protein